MRLIGMLDSPYVRRVAVSLKLMGIVCELDQISVFRGFDQFKAINPVVKAPTFVTEDGLVLMDSSLILDYLEHRAGPANSLMPSDPRRRAETLRIIGLALAANEKAVQIVYERNLRPQEKQHEPWLERVRGQLLGALTELEAEAARHSGWFGGGQMTQADITVAVAWRFARYVLPDIVAAESYPGLAAHSARAEILPAFVETGF